MIHVFAADVAPIVPFVEPVTDPSNLPYVLGAICAIGCVGVVALAALVAAVVILLRRRSRSRGK